MMTMMLQVRWYKNNMALDTHTMPGHTRQHSSQVRWYNIHVQYCTVLYCAVIYTTVLSTDDNISSARPWHHGHPSALPHRGQVIIIVTWLNTVK